MQAFLISLNLFNNSPRWKTELMRPSFTSMSFNSRFLASKTVLNPYPANVENMVSS